MLCLEDFLTSSFFFLPLLIGDLLGCKEMELDFWRTDSFFFFFLVPGVRCFMISVWPTPCIAIQQDDPAFI